MAINFHLRLFGDGGPLETENNVTTLVKETKASKIAHRNFFFAISGVVN
jgi:hypothetical protein